MTLNPSLHDETPSNPLSVGQQLTVIAHALRLNAWEERSKGQWYHPTHSSHDWFRLGLAYTLGEATLELEKYNVMAERLNKGVLWKYRGACPIKVLQTDEKLLKHAELKKISNSIAKLLATPEIPA